MFKWAYLGVGAERVGLDSDTERERWCEVGSSSLEELEEEW